MIKRILNFFSHLLLFLVLQYLPNIFCNRSIYDELILYGFPNNFYFVKSYNSKEDMCGIVETDFRIENLIFNILIYFITFWFIKYFYRTKTNSNN